MHQRQFSWKKTCKKPGKTRKHSPIVCQTQLLLCAFFEYKRQVKMQLLLIITRDLEVEVALPRHLFLQDLKLAQIQPDKKEIKRELKTKETLGLCNKG